MPTTPLSTRAPRSSLTTVAPPAGVETFDVETGHVAPGESVTYAQTPPVGGRHDPAWQRCDFYDAPVPTERAVHSLEHGITWITYRPDTPSSEKVVLAELARTERIVLVSRWDQGLPAPIVASSWGRQMLLESARDPRLMQFILAFAGKSPEPLGSCE